MLLRANSILDWEPCTGALIKDTVKKDIVGNVTGVYKENMWQ